MKLLMVFVTCPSAKQARQLARVLIDRRLAACVNLLPNLDSLFWWQGKVDRAREVLLIIKTTEQRFPALQQAVTSLHPYEVPEILALRVERALPRYHQWVQQSLRGRS